MDNNYSISTRHAPGSPTGDSAVTLRDARVLTPNAQGFARQLTIAAGSGAVTIREGQAHG